MAKLCSKISIKFHSRFFESGNFFELNPAHTCFA